MLPKLKKYYRWLAKYRDFDGDGLLTIISPFESGMDWKPTYDVALGLPEKKGEREAVPEGRGGRLEKLSE